MYPLLCYLLILFREYTALFSMLSLCHFSEYRDNTGSDTFQSEDVTALEGCPISKSQDSPYTYFRGLRLRAKN